MRFKKVNAQALAELAIFGSFFIMLLGVLISYGLRYNAQQRASQQGFRAALGSVSNKSPGSASHMVINFQHIPDPANPLGIGTVVPVSSYGSVTRDYQMHLTAGSEGDLPRLIMDIEGLEVDEEAKEDGMCPSSGRGCNSSGFRNEQGVDYQGEDDIEEGDDETYQMQKYQEIFGYGNVEKCDDGKFGTGQPCAAGSIRIIDSSAGETINYESAVRTCRQLVDTDVCETECNRGTPEGSDKNCVSICAAKTNSPNQSNSDYNKSRGGAWYCANYEETGSNDKYKFPVLEQLFANTGSGKAMGLQMASSVKETNLNNTLIRTENEDGVTVTESAVEWKDVITYDLIYSPYYHTGPGQRCRSYRYDAKECLPTKSKNVPDIGDSGDVEGIQIKKKRVIAEVGLNGVNTYLEEGEEDEESDEE